LSYVTITNGTSVPNFLESEVGLVLKTREIPDAMGVADGDRKIVKAGTPYPADDTTAEGLVYTNTDVTDGPVAGSVMVGGRVLAARLSVGDEAKTALETAGIKFVDGPDITRP